MLPAGITDAPSVTKKGALQPSATITRKLQTDQAALADVSGALKRGVDRYLAGQFASVLESLPGEQEAAASLLGDYILLYRGRANLKLERYQEALNSFRLLEQQFSDSPLIRESLTGQCQALLKLDNPRSALAILSGDRFKPDAEWAYLKAQAHQAAGEKEKAIEQYLQVYSRYPDSKFSPLAERSLLSLSPKALTGNRNYAARLQRADSLIKAANARGARLLLLALGKVPAPDSPSSERRNLLLAEAEYRLGRASTALTCLRKVTAEDSALHARALYLEGACYRKLEKEEAMLAARDKALKLYPNSQDTQELCYSVAAYFDLNYRYTKASEAYGLLYKAFPKGRHADRALWKASILAFQSAQYDEAALGFWNYVISHPSPHQAGPALYWMGRCCQSLNDYGNAKYFYGRAHALANESYYGQRAREAASALQQALDSKAARISGIDFTQAVRICDGMQYPPVSIPEPGEIAAPFVSRASALAEADLEDFAISELRWGSRRYPQEAGALNHEISRICASREDHNGAISALRRVFPDYVTRPSGSLPDEVWQRFYPIRHWEIISSRAGTNKLDPALILAVIRQESGFNEKARSRANARGLMQIIPSTGRRLALQARIAKYSVASLYRAETNITLGTKFLASLAQRYDAAELALAAYNAGSTRVDRWLAEFGRGDMPLFVEQIPFSETRNYVMQALSNKARYDLMTSSAGTEAR